MDESCVAYVGSVLEQTSAPKNLRKSVVSYKHLIQFMWQFLQEEKWRVLIIFIMTSIVWALDALLWPCILHVVVDIFTQYDSTRSTAWDALRWPLISGVFLCVFIEIACRVMGFLMAKVIPQIQATIRIQMFDHIQHHAPRYFNDRFTGNIANKITDMTMQMECILQQLFWPIVPALFTSILGACFLWGVSPLFTWMLLSWVVIHVTLCILFGRITDRYQHHYGELSNALSGKIVDSLNNNFSVNLFYRFAYERQRLTHLQTFTKQVHIQAKSSLETMRCFLSVVYFGFVIIGIYGFMIYMWMHHHITTGQVVQIFTFVWTVAMMLWSVSGVLPMVFQAFGLAKQAYSVMCDPQDIADLPGSKALVISSGEIIFDNVSFRHGEKKLFENYHIHIKGGENIGLVGFTGSGKSTFINLILRFFPLQSGSIFIDNQNIAEGTLESLRRQIALIPQDPILFHRSVRENICYGKLNATETEMIEAAQLAGCHDFIQNLPGQYDYQVGDRGAKLSGGEKQRIMIARALLLNAPILVLDEATSALDTVTEKYIQDSLAKIMENRTTLVIAHRLSTLLHMDRILVFDKGKIIEEGSHNKLLNDNGLYTKMWNMQNKGFLPARETKKGTS